MFITNFQLNKQNPKPKLQKNRKQLNHQPIKTYRKVSFYLNVSQYHFQFLYIIMQPTQPQSPFLKVVPQSQQVYFTKRITNMFQSDKENVMSKSPKIEVNKMQIGEGEIDEFLVEVGEIVKLKKENVRDLLKGLEKDNSPKKVIIGILGHKPLQVQKAKPILGQKPLPQQTEQPLMNLNILLKLRHQQFPYISMFTCNCLMEILKLYIKKRTEFKEEDLSLKWKYGFYLEKFKIGEVLVFHQVKGEDLFVNIAIRMKLGGIASDQREFVGDLLQEFGSRLNISKNLRQSSTQIHHLYQSSLMFLGQEVIIKRRQPNQWEDMVKGKFIRVNQVGHAILQGEEGNEEEIEDGYMELREDGEELGGEEEGEGEQLKGIAI